MLITATVRCKGQTGVEMEALTAVSVAALTIYDMAKALEKTMVIGEIKLVEKLGGKSGSLAADRRRSGLTLKESKGKAMKVTVRLFAPYVNRRDGKRKRSV